MLDRQEWSVLRMQQNEEFSKNDLVEEMDNKENIDIIKVSKRQKSEEKMFIEDLNETSVERQRIKSKATISSIVFLTVVIICIIIGGISTGVLLYQGMEKEDPVEIPYVPVEAEPIEEMYTYKEVQEMLEKEREEIAANTTANKDESLETMKALLEAGSSISETLRVMYPDDIIMLSGGRYHFVPINRSLKMNQFTEDNLVKKSSGELQYLEGDQIISHKGIDVSKHQGKIDWKKVAGDGVEFAFLRVAFRGYGKEGKLVLDDSFEQNIKDAIANHIKVGVYIYSQAMNEEELMEEANLVLEAIAPYKIECPVVYDVEKVSGADGRMNSLDPKTRTDLTILFCDTIAKAGYKPMIYHNMEMGALMLEIDRLEAYDKWFAYYNKELYYPYEYKIWQYSDKGKINGIKTEVDLNISFGPIWE